MTGTSLVLELIHPQHEILVPLILRGVPLNIYDYQPRHFYIGVPPPLGKTSWINA